MLICYRRGQGSIILRVKILNSSVATGAGLTGLTSASAGLIISTIADNESAPTVYSGSNLETITTLGTYAAPTAGKARFKEVDSTNHRGVYEVQLADARYAVSGAKSLLVSISGAANAAECDALIPLNLQTEGPDGYVDGYTYVRNSGEAGTDVGVNGTLQKPCSSAADAVDVATARGQKKIRLLPESGGDTVTLDAADYSGFAFDLNGCRLDLNFQVQDQGTTPNTRFESSKAGASLLNDLFGSPDNPLRMVGSYYHNLGLTNPDFRGQTYVSSCSIEGSLTVGAAGSWVATLEECYAIQSDLPINFGSWVGSSQTLRLLGWAGDITISNMRAGQSLEIYGYAGKTVIATSCTGGTVRHTSHHEVFEDDGVTAWDTSNTTNRPTVELVSDATATDARTGARTVTITVDDGTNPLENAIVRVTQGAESYVLLTDVNGEVVFHLDDATWAVVITKPLYTFAGASLVVDGNEAVTYSMTELAITPSAGPNQVTGFLIVHDEEGQPVSGVKVYIKQTKTASSSGIAYDGTPRSATSDVNGLVEFPGMYVGGRYKMYREADEPNAVHITVEDDATDPYELPSIISRS